MVQSLWDSVARCSGRKKQQRHGTEQASAAYAGSDHPQARRGQQTPGVSGQELNEVCRHLEIAESTWHRWLAQYGGMKANEAKRLKELEAQNARLKKLSPTRLSTRSLASTVPRCA